MFNYQDINVSQMHYISLLFKQSVVNIIWPLLDDSLWTSIIVQCYNTVMSSGTFEVLRTQPSAKWFQTAVHLQFFCPPLCISHFSAVFFVSWLLLLICCPHFVGTCWVRSQAWPAILKVQTQLANPLECLYTEPDPKDLRPSCLQVSRGSFESDFLEQKTQWPWSIGTPSS